MKHFPRYAASLHQQALAQALRAPLKPPRHHREGDSAFQAFLASLGASQ